MSYTDAGMIADKLGLTLTTPQQTVATRLAGQVTAQIERQTGRSWQQTAVTDERHIIEGAYIQLVARPVTVVSAVRTRSLIVGQPWTTLAAGTQYELIDPAGGVLSLLAWWDWYFWGRPDFITDQLSGHLGYLCAVDYTAEPVIPADIQQAATLLAAADLLSTLQPSLNGLTQINVSGAISLTATDETEWRQEAAAIIKSWRKPVFA